MAILIDGYNLLHAAGIIPRGVGPGGLHRSRMALLNFLAESIDPGEVPRTTVVFDAWEAPWGMPRSMTHRGLTVLFASPDGDADAMIERLIRKESAPRRLTVVSSDHRLHRAARRRKATPVDSDVWYARVVQQRSDRHRTQPAEPGKPPVPLLTEDVEYWYRLFGGESMEETLQAELWEGAPDAAPVPREPAEQEPPVADPLIDNPFPPGYGEDLLEGADFDDPFHPFPPGYGNDVDDA